MSCLMLLWACQLQFGRLRCSLAAAFQCQLGVTLHQAREGGEVPPNLSEHTPKLGSTYKTINKEQNKNAIICTKHGRFMFIVKLNSCLA